jgi:geranylgeranyl pyrophosphate synthase
MDDILDFVGDERVLGKPCGSDVKGGDITLPLISALRNAPASDREALENLISCADSEDGVLDELMDLVERHGGFSYAKDMAAQCAKEAKGFLVSFEPSPSRNALQFAADYVVRRNF